MQPNLPLAIQLATGQMHAQGVLIDFEARTLRPVSIRSLGLLLARVNRYGVQSGLRSENICNVLFHSIFVGHIAQALAASGRLDHIETGIVGLDGEMLSWSSDVICDLLGLYAGLHDSGEIFGGDLVNLLPDAVAAPLKQYQKQCQRNIIRQLGLPVLAPALKQVIKLADLMAVPAEMALLPSVNRSQGASALRALEAAGIDLDPLLFVAPLVEELLPRGRFMRFHVVMRAWVKLMTPTLMLLSKGNLSLSVMQAAVSGSDIPRSKKKGEVVSTSALIKRMAPGFTGNLHDLTGLRTVGHGQIWRVENTRLICVQETA